MAKQSQAHTNSSSSKQPQKMAKKLKTSVSNNQPSTSKVRVLKIANLPNEMLDRIFNKLKTNEQCKLRGVCHRWKDSVEQIFAETRLLKLNLLWTDRKHKCHKWSPAISIQSMQFDSNWTEPTLELSKKAQLTVQENRFSEDCVYAFGSLFSQIHYLVIYFELDEDEKNFNNFILLIDGFKELKSFSLIRARRLFDVHFIPKLCHTLEQFSQLRRLELYLEQADNKGTPKQEIKMVKSLARLEHFALSSWPPVTTKDNQENMLKNVGRSHVNAREGNESLELTTLCFPIHSYKLNYNRVNIDPSVFENNRQLQNIKRLQLTNVAPRLKIEIDKFVHLWPKLQSLELYFDDVQRDMNTNSCIEIINKCERLIELKIFNCSLTPFEDGPIAHNIRKLTIVKEWQFKYFNVLLREQEEEQERTRSWQVSVADEFSRLISLKFPSLEELTVLTSDRLNRKSCIKIKNMIVKKLRANFENLKVNIELGHVIYKNKERPY